MNSTHVDGPGESLALHTQQARAYTRGWRDALSGKQPHGDVRAVEFYRIGHADGTAKRARMARGVPA